MAVFHISQHTASLHHKEVYRTMKNKMVFKSKQSNDWALLTKMYTHRHGANAALKSFGKLGGEASVTDYEAMIQICIKKVRKTNDEDVALKEFQWAYRVFESMRKSGFEIREETYCPFLMLIIDMRMVEEFHFFCEFLKMENPNVFSRLAYYEMLLWIKVNDGDKIQMLIANTHESAESNCNEGYLVALCEWNRREEVSMLLKTIDITKVSSKENMGKIFKSLGRLSLESDAKKLMLELNPEGQGVHDLSNLILSYAMSIPNILIEDTVIKFKNLQAELKVASSSAPYEKLIKTCCDSLEVCLAIDLVESMFEEGLTVHRINKMINDHNIDPDAETFRSMIGLCVKLKTFDRAYNMIEDLKRLNLIPTADMYNAIMDGYFRQKNFHEGLMVLKQMHMSNVKPDS